MKQRQVIAESRRENAAAQPALVRLAGVGVRYRLLTERDRTIKGRLFDALSGGRQQRQEFWALRGVNAEFHQGEVIGIVGANGSGKSTLMRVIARILYPTEGQVTCHGEVRPLLDLASSLNVNLTGRQNAFLYAALNRIPRQTMEEMIPNIVDFSELGSFFDVPVRMYSSGMVARLSFALATQKRPDILLVDEVLAVGDEHFQRKSFFRMTKLIERGSLVVIVSHNLPFLEQVCTRALLLASGEVVADGRPAEVVAKYKRRIVP
jgi:ABC-type polysaccharide/polyol phosphate transport system ATPase subunit